MSSLTGSSWRSAGYGWILRFTGDGYTLHHVTRDDDIVGERGSLDEFRRSFDRIEGGVADVLSLHQAGDLTRYGFRRIAPNESPSTKPAPGADADPVRNFELLWQTFSEHYAFFSLHGVDWAEAYWVHQHRVSHATPDDELFAIFSDLLAPLDDGHVTLAAPGKLHLPMRNVALRRAMQGAFSTPTLRITPRANMDAISAGVEPILLAPFASTRSPVRRAANDLFTWCELMPGIGYLSVLRLFGFADSTAARTADDLPEARLATAEFLREDMRALDGILDEIFTELRHCRGLVLDLRINGGGFDRAGLVIAGRFADRQREAWRKRAVDRGEFTLEQSIHVEPAAAPFLQPVVVLTSPMCVSAGEVMALALRALPQVTLLGECTAGMLSDNLRKPLANGWELSLSNEIYTSHDGHEYEGRGIVPDVPVIATDAAQLVGTLQSSLVAAIALLQGGAPNPSARATR